MIIQRVVTSQMFQGVAIYGSAPTGLMRQSYVASFKAISLSPPYTWEVTGTLPPTIGFAVTSGAAANDTITFSSANLSTDGTYVVTLTVRNADRIRASITITFVIIASEPDNAIIDEFGNFFVDEHGNFIVYS